MDNEIPVRYTECLMKAALKRCGNIEDAQDLVQETLLAALSLADMPENPKAWLMSVLKRKFYDLLRRKYQKPVVCIDMAADIPYEDETLYKAEQQEEAAEVRRCVAQLAAVYRDVLVRYYFKSESVREIAAALGISESAVKMRLFTGREHIRKEFEMESYTNNSYAPETLYMSSSGQLGLNNEPFSLVPNDDKISQNLLILAYQKPLTITELSKAIGIGAAYVEPIVDKLVKGELMKRVSDKVYTDFVIFTDEDKLTGLETEKKLAEKIWRDIWSVIEEELNEIRSESCYKALRRSQQQKLEAYYAVKTLRHALTDAINSAAGFVGEQIFDTIPDRPNGGKWYAMGSHGKADGFRDFNNENLGKYFSGGNHTTKVGDTICLAGFETSLGRTYSVLKSYIRGCSMYEGEASFEVAKTLYAVHTNDTNMLSIIPHALENLDGLEKAGFLTKDGQDNRIVDIPVITMDERGALENICGKYNDILTEKFGEELKRLFANPVPVPPHLNVPMWVRLMYCADTFVMRVIYNAIENKAFLPDYDENTPVPAEVLFIKE